MPGTCGGRRWLGGRGRGRDGSVDDLSGWPADVGGWGWVASDDGGHVLYGQALEKMIESREGGVEGKGRRRRGGYIFQMTNGGIEK